MSDENFYKNRILWKANQSDLFSRSCTEFGKIEKNRHDHILSRTTLQGEPILVFWSSEILWTLLTSAEIVSEIGSSLNSIFLDEIKRIVKIEEVVSSRDQATKLESEFLNLGEFGTRIWAPRGAEIFSLMNILKIFPLRPVVPTIHIATSNVK